MILKVDLGVSRRLIFHYDREVGENFKKIHNSLYYVPDSQKKNSLPDLAHGFHGTPSKLGTNRPKICLILSSTSVFNVFAKTGESGAKILFSVLLFNVTTKGS